MAEMYGSYSDEDLNDWERLPLNAQVLTSSAFGAWLMRRDERIKESKKGHWIDKFAGVYRCSCCREIIEIDIEIDHPNGITFNYCPNCGAKMESEDKK